MNLRLCMSHLNKNLSNLLLQSSSGASNVIILLFLFELKWCLGSRYRICTRSSCSHTNPLGVGGWDLCCSYWTGRIFFSLVYVSVYYEALLEFFWIYIYIYTLDIDLRWKLTTLLLLSPNLLKSSYMAKVRVPVGKLILELPAGMLDDDKGDFVGTAAREVSLSLSLSLFYTRTE